MRARPEGSSPLARGLRCLSSARLGSPGIIPARAGFTCIECKVVLGVGDHPRSRGVYRPPDRRFHRPGGSSPLARGLPPRPNGPRRPHRIIPARAGFTFNGSSILRRTRDHPRSRGVYMPYYNKLYLSEGSSPLARGLHPRRPRQQDGRRIIPARAGFTSPSSNLCRLVKDHPRSRGVYTHDALANKMAAGSSPLARGLPSVFLTTRETSRIIPARAGFTMRSSSGRSPGSDHPRSRGVYPRAITRTLSPAGSSPLARGLQRRVEGVPKPLGIIPARAGFTR